MNSDVRILLVEDNDGDAELTQESLEAAMVNLRVNRVIDGGEALDLLRAGLERPSELPDLVVLDLNLPGMPGRQVLEAMGRDAVLKKVPVVILTSSDSAEDISRSYELGANCYVTKPVGLAEFRSVVKSVQDFWLGLARLPS